MIRLTDVLLDGVLCDVETFEEGDALPSFYTKYFTVVTDVMVTLSAVATITSSQGFQDDSALTMCAVLDVTLKELSSPNSDCPRNMCHISRCHAWRVLMIDFQEPAAML
jgi:hypothetical protein